MTTTNIQAQAKGQIIDNFYNMCSDPANIHGLWFFDQDGASTTVTDRSTKATNGVLSANGSTLSPNYQGLCPYLDLTSNAYFETQGTSGSYMYFDDVPFTIIVLCNLNDATLSTFLCDGFGTSDSRRWEFKTDGSDKLAFYCYDQNGAGQADDDYIGRYYNTAITGDEGTWHCYIATWDGTTSSTGIKIYRDGIKVDDTTHETGSFAGQPNLISLNIGTYGITTLGARARYFDGKIGILSAIKEEISAEKIKGLSQSLLAYANSLT